MNDGHTFGGRYESIERIGTGGMAEVYRARDTLLGREVAVKVLSRRFATDPSFVERFRREAQSAANLNHPNIVSLFDFGSDGDTYFIVMEYIDGRSLSEIVRESGPLLPERAAEISSDVAKALSRAHSAGLVHRDIKPSNIMITSNGQTKVTDFGIARAVSGDGDQTMTQTGMVIGTAAYLSPEQAQGSPVDQRSDIYSLGCVLYETLTGQAPFSGETPLAIAYKHVREDVPPPSRLNPDVPAALDAVVLKAMAKNPDNRYQTATETQEDLERFLTGQKVMATPVDSTMVSTGVAGTRVMDEIDDGPPARRSSGWWYALVALLGVALIGFVVWLLADGLSGKTVKVPDVIGKDRDDAVRLIDQAGLDWEVKDRSSQKPVGQVVDQDPTGDAEIEEGETVTLFVSVGPRSVEVPDLSGMTEAEAETALEDANLVLGDVDEGPSDQFEEGEIFDQTPDAFQEAPAGSEVNVVVSTGPAPAGVPSVIGLTEQEAIAQIAAAGFEVSILREPSEEEEGVVIAQDPAAETELEQGETVTITVSEGSGEFPMPNVTGQPADDAQAQLEDMGLIVNREEEVCAGAEPPGTVCRSDPEPDTPVREGDTVTIYVQPG